MASLSRFLRIKPHFNHHNFSSIAKLDSSTPPLTHKQKVQTALSLLQSKNKNPAEQLLFLALSDAVSKFSHNQSTPEFIPSFLQELKTQPSLMCSFLDELKSRPELKKERYFCNFITLYTQVGMFDKALETFKDMPANGISLSTESFNTLFHNALFVSSSESYDLLRNLSIFTMADEVKLDVDTYNLIIKLCIKWGCHDMREKISQLLYLMKDDSCKPDDTTDSIILGGLYSETPEKTLEVLNSLEKNHMSIKLYNHWIATLYDLGRITEAKLLIEKMSSKGIKPNARTYQYLFRAYGEAGDVKEMRSFYNDMSEKDVECDKYCYETLVQSLCKIGDFETALQACKNYMSKERFPLVFVLNLSTVKKLVNGLVVNSQYEKLEEFVGLMEESGLRLGVHIYNFTVESMCDEMKINEAMTVFEKMMLRGVQPNVDTYRHLVRALDKDGNAEEITRLYKSMLDIGVDPDTYHFKIIKAYMICIWKEFHLRCKFPSDGSIMESIRNFLKKDPSAVDADTEGGFQKNRFLKKKLREGYQDFRTDPALVNTTLCLLSFTVCYHLGLKLS